MAIGDAMGMPPELWSPQTVHGTLWCNYRLFRRMSGNIISYQYKAGQFTDDTSQALTI